MMDRGWGLALLLVVSAVVLVFVLRSCQRTKEVEIHQKSTDKKTTMSLEIEKEKQPKPQENNQ